MMIQSFFLLSNSGEIIIEKHWRHTTPRSICDFFWAEVSKYDSKADVPPVIGSSQYYLISIYRSDVFMVAAVTKETNVLSIIEFLHRIFDVLEDYFTILDEDSIKDNFSTIYQILEEMVDYGYALITEPNLLKSLIPPPSIVSQIAQAVTFNSAATSISDSLPDGTLGNMPWRKTGVHYSQNEIYLDIVEEVDAILDKNSLVITSEVTGIILANSRLSGTPDLLLTFNNPALIDDCSFHPCVRYSRYEKEKSVSFVPPDGVFELMKYRLARQSNVSIPLYCQPNIHVEKGAVHMTVLVGVRSQNSLALPASTSLTIEEVVVEIPFTKNVRTASLKVSAGALLFDEASKVATWTIGKLTVGTTPQLTGSVTMTSSSEYSTGAKSPGALNESTVAPSVSLQWRVSLASISGLAISSLQLFNESYKPYKGMRSIAKSGKIQIRTF